MYEYHGDERGPPCRTAPLSSGATAYGQIRMANPSTHRCRGRGSRMFFKLDLQSGFHQLRIQESDQHKTAFTTPCGQHEWVTCLFGLANAPSCLKRLMNHVLREHIAADHFVVYCIHALIFSTTDDLAEHLLKLNVVLQTLCQHEFLVKGLKTELFWKEVEFLCFHLLQDEWAPTESKVAVIVEWFPEM